MKNLTFDALPETVAQLIKEVKEVKYLLQNSQTTPQEKSDDPIQIEDVVHLTGLTKPTLYGYCQRNEIPYHKKGNRLYFFKSQIIDWIKTGKQKTLKEIEVDAEAYLSNPKNQLK